MYRTVRSLFQNFKRTCLPRGIKPTVWNFDVVFRSLICPTYEPWFRDMLHLGPGLSQDDQWDAWHVLWGQVVLLQRHKIWQCLTSTSRSLLSLFPSTSWTKMERCCFVQSELSSGISLGMNKIILPTVISLSPPAAWRKRSTRTQFYSYSIRHTRWPLTVTAVLQLSQLAKLFLHKEVEIYLPKLWCTYKKISLMVIWQSNSARFQKQWRQKLLAITFMKMTEFSSVALWKTFRREVMVNLRNRSMCVIIKKCI